MLEESVRRLHSSIGDLRAEALVVALRKGSGIPITPREAASLLANGASLAEVADLVRSRYQTPAPTKPAHDDFATEGTVAPRPTRSGEGASAGYGLRLSIAGLVCMAILVVEYVGLDLLTKHIVQQYSARLFGYLVLILNWH